MRFKSQSVDSNGQALRSQIVTLKKGHGQHSKYLPFALKQIINQEKDPRKPIGFKTVK